MNTVHPIVANNGFSNAAHLGSKKTEESESQSWMIARATPGKPVLSANELTSLSAMISYVANHSGSTEFRVERSLANRFNIPNAKFLPANEFDSAIRYLADSMSA
ncbi:MAG: hypothetical protein KGI97_05065 [Alphaproteobacteria bacterium]|nr:hypothetical protein [Alphaproteobacteria bacterium]